MTNQAPQTTPGGRCEPDSKRVPLPVSSAVTPADTGTRRPVSTMGRKRALVLAGIHLVMIAHFAQWAITGTTLSPVEPSETMYTLNKGYLNAGAIFFALALLATLIWGRYFCGWGCHLVAVQDLCGWGLKKMGIRPHAFRSRFLFHAPFALAIYMFVWPSVYRWWNDIPPPTLQNHIVTSDFWATFPGPLMAIVTLLVCGFVIIYAMGAKAFCTYGCPYGGFFAPIDRVSPGRIRVTDDCRHCGHCTTVCTSNVRVHEEVAKFGMVVDPGCMKCMDCVSVCPNDALYFGFGRPALGAKPASPPRKVPYDFTWGEEIFMLLVGLAVLWIYRGLYDAVPLLMAMGVAAILSFWSVKVLRFVRDNNVKLQNLQLKKGGRISRAGYAFGAVSLVLALFTVHSAWLQYNVHYFEREQSTIELPDAIWVPRVDFWAVADGEIRGEVDRAVGYFEKADAAALFPLPKLYQQVVPLYLARGELDQAESVARKRVDVLPGQVESHVHLGSVLRKQERFAEARGCYERALAIDPCFPPARAAMGSLLEMTGKIDEALACYREGADRCDAPRWHLSAAGMLRRRGRIDEAVAELRAVLAEEPDNHRARFDAGVMLMEGVRDLPAAIAQFEELVRRSPNFADGWYNLGVAQFSARKLDDARRSIARAIEVNPEDPMNHGFFAVVLRELGEVEAAEAEEREAARLKRRGMP